MEENKNLRYFVTENIPMTVTSGCLEAIGSRMANLLFVLGYHRGKEMADKQLDSERASYMQVFNIETVKEDGKYTVKIRMKQEQPDYETEYTVSSSTYREFNGTIWLVESWNGKTKDVTPDDHYMTLLLPEEY